MGSHLAWEINRPVWTGLQLCDCGLHDSDLLGCDERLGELSGEKLSAGW